MRAIKLSENGFERLEALAERCGVASTTRVLFWQSGEENADGSFTAKAVTCDDWIVDILERLVKALPV